MIEIETSEGVAVVRLARAPANAMNDELLQRLGEVVARLASDDNARAIVITGKDAFFSAGLDLFEIIDYDAARWTRFAKSFDAAFTALFGLDKPVVAAINGHAIAGGGVLAACADFRLMSESGGKIGLTEIQVGVHFPATAFEPVRFTCAGPRLREVLYRGLNYAPKDAVAMNLVDEVVPANELSTRAFALAKELGDRSPAAFASTKRALRAGARARITAATVDGFDPVWSTWQSPSVRSAIEAYRDRILSKRSVSKAP